MEQYQGYDAFKHGETVHKLVKEIASQNPFQKKYLMQIIGDMGEDEIKTFEVLLQYYRRNGYSVEDIAEYYLEFIEDIMEEQRFFRKNGRYRYSDAGQVEEVVYKNKKYMQMYMVGLAVSTYLLDPHRKYMQWYSDRIRSLYGGVWLEIGPGHGEYLVKAMELTSFREYHGIDISEASVEMCRSLIENQGEKMVGKKYKLNQADFLKMETVKADAVVCGEVLEHVDDPSLFMKKIYAITDTSSFIYITTVVNCPQKDHIYLFKSVNEVEALYRHCGFEIKDSLYCPTNGYSMEKAIKMKAAINTAHVLKHI